VANLLDILGGVAQVATRGKTAVLQGQRAGREDAQTDLLARIKQEQIADERGRAAEMQDLQRRNILDLIRERNEPAAPDRRIQDGAVVDMGTAVATPIQGLPSAQKTYEEREENGGVAIYENGQFSKWKMHPPQERGSNPMLEFTKEQQRFTREQGLADDFRQEQDIKDAKGVAGAVTTIRGALSNPTPQGDLAAIYALVKLYDPGSVVREGEIALTQGAASLPEQVRRLYEGWTTGKKLTPQMRADLASIANSIVGQRQEQINPTLARYGSKARRWQADSAAVAPNPLEGATIPTDILTKYQLTPPPRKP
jgi:hypothetical protein